MNDKTACRITLLQNAVDAERDARHQFDRTAANFSHNPSASNYYELGQAVSYYQETVNTRRERQEVLREAVRDSGCPVL